MQEIVFEINGQHYEAVVSNKTWKRSLLGSNYLTVEHPSQSYVVVITTEGFEAFPIEEDE